MEKIITGRGFALIEFTDLYGAKCSLQKSSLATEDAIWLGVDDAKPKIMASKTPQGGIGWVPYEIPQNVLLTTRMHLTREQAKELVEALNVFVETGELWWILKYMGGMIVAKYTVMEEFFHWRWLSVRTSVSGLLKSLSASTQ